MEKVFPKLTEEDNLRRNFERLANQHLHVSNGYAEEVGTDELSWRQDEDGTFSIVVKTNGEVRQAGIPSREELLLVLRAIGNGIVDWPHRGRVIWPHPRRWSDAC